jgi:CHASE1-domain containing sensor protein
LEILTGLLFFTTIVCALWLRFSSEVNPESSKNFHMVLGALGTVLAVILMVILSEQ